MMLFSILFVFFVKNTNNILITKQTAIENLIKYNKYYE